MQSYGTLIELTHVVSVGDHVAWIGNLDIDNAGERVHPKTVTGIDEGSEWIRVDGEGHRGGLYFYKAYIDGSSEAFFSNPSKDSPVYKGEVVVAIKADPDEETPPAVRRGYYDLTVE